MGCSTRVSKAWRRTPVFGLAVAACLLFIGFGASVATATPITAFNGNSILSGTGLDGTINFAVFALPDPAITNISSSFVPGATSPPLPSSGFVYLYQPVNDRTPSQPDVLQTVSQKLGGPGNSSPFSPSSWGYFDHLVFCTTPSCSATVAPGTALSNGGTPGFITNTGAFNPATLTLTSTLDATYPLGQILEPGTSTLLAFTSPIGPQFDLTGVTFGGTGLATGRDPDPAPEPSTILLSSVGLAAFAPYLRGRLRWRRGQAAAS